MLYRRSKNLFILLQMLRKNTGRLPASDIEIAQARRRLETSLSNRSSAVSENLYAAVGVEVLEGNRGAVCPVDFYDPWSTGKPDPLQISIEVEHRPAL